RSVAGPDVIGRDRWSRRVVVTPSGDHEIALRVGGLALLIGEGFERHVAPSGEFEILEHLRLVVLPRRLGGSARRRYRGGLLDGLLGLLLDDLGIASAAGVAVARYVVGGGKRYTPLRRCGQLRTERVVDGLSQIRDGAVTEIGVDDDHPKAV